MRAMMLVPTAVLLAGCAAVEDKQASRERSALERQLAERAPGPAENCVPQRQNQSLRAVDRQTIVYEDGPILWVNRLEADCAGLRPDSILIVETFAGSYCRNDVVRTLQPGSTIPGPHCRLADFTPYRRR